MKKIFLYLIIFISVFLGTASAVVFNGYSNYEKQKEDVTQIEQDTSLLSTLASSILESEAYSGKIEFCDNANSVNLKGSFAYVKSRELQAEIILSGYVKNLDVNLNLTLLGKQIYIDFNGAKITCTIDDVLKIFNNIVSSINFNANASLPKIDISSLTSSLNNITLTETEIGNTLNLSIPNLCDIFLLTTFENVPKQIIITNINFAGGTYSLNVNAKQEKQEIKEINKDDYLNISSSLDYIEPVLNTLMQEKLRISGNITINGTTINLNLYKKDKLILGDITYKDFTINFEYENGFITAKLYNLYFKFTPNDAAYLLTDLLNIDLSTPLNITDINLKSLTSNINASACLTSGLISNLNIEYSGIKAELNIGKTLIFPQRLATQESYLNHKDILNFIDLYSNAISNKFSIDATATVYNTEINGKIYLELSENFNNLKCLYFDGKIESHKIQIWYTPNCSYVSYNNINLKIENAAIPKLISSIEELLEISILPKNSEDLFELDFNQISYKNKILSVSGEKGSLSILPQTNNYLVSLDSNNINLTAFVYPGKTHYKSLLNNLNKEDFKDITNSPDLLYALSSTIKQPNISYKGNLSINIGNFNYSNVYVDINYITSSKKLVITLDNLPLDNIVTYYSHLYYSNQKCVLTIYDGLINIHNTMTTRAFSREFTRINKTLMLAEFSIDNLFDIFGMRYSIIDTIKKQNSTGDSSQLFKNLSLDCINLLKDQLIFTHNIEFNKFIAYINLTFNYTDIINSLNASINIGDVVFVNLNLYNY